MRQQILSGIAGKFAARVSRRSREVVRILLFIASSSMQMEHRKQENQL